VKKYQPLFLSLLSGVLFFLAWPTLSFSVAVFFAFIPLFIIEQQQYSRAKYFGLIYLALFVWNVTTTWWIWNSTIIGAVMAILANSLLMSIPWMGFTYINKKLGTAWAYPSFIIFWMSFEYIHLQDWGLSWPWLTLGNVFASRVEWVQWYEYTGTSGGTLWILLVNVLVYKTFLSANFSWKRIAVVSTALTFPIVLSLFFIDIKDEKESKSNFNAPIVYPWFIDPKNVNVVVVQPNIDPYIKIETGTFEAQLQQLIRLSESKIDSNTTLLIWPETALYSPNGFDEANLSSNFFLNPLFAFLKRHPQLQLFTGIESYRVFNEKISNVARPIEGTTNFYEVYNSSVLLDSTGAKQFYHKSMLVPGVETLPKFLLFLGPVFEKFGGTTGGYATQKERTPVKTNYSFALAPAICYESIYGEYISKYIAQGANLITIITNDGWWGNTQGHKQHQLYARIRAIETRTWVARSANTGISCFINPAGEVIDAQPWGKEAAIKQHMGAASSKTFFVEYGDLLSKAALLLSAFVLLMALYKRVMKK
jgi:apolipoprotein N-acyltransferase